jgi:hypothetical protein
LTSYLLHIFGAAEGRPLHEGTLRFTDQLVGAIDSPGRRYTDERRQGAMWILSRPTYPDGLVQQIRVLWEGKALPGAH